jgi:transposase-like protein
MTFNRIQFQSGMSLSEFLRSFGTEANCAAALKCARWPGGFRCPRCDGDAHYVAGHGARRLFQCNGCRHQTSLTAGSPMEHTKLPLTTWFLAIYLISQAKTGLSALALKRQIGVSYTTAWLLHQKINRAMAGRESCHWLEGAVQVDDAYLGRACRRQAWARLGEQGALRGCGVAGRQGPTPILEAQHGQRLQLRGYRHLGQGIPGARLRGHQRAWLASPP